VEVLRSRSQSLGMKLKVLWYENNIKRYEKNIKRYENNVKRYEIEELVYKNYSSMKKRPWYEKYHRYETPKDMKMFSYEKLT
jgi:hypothetical protein